MSKLIGEEITVVEYHEGNGDEEITIPLRIMIDRLTAALEQVPDELKDSAVLHVRSFGDCASTYVKVLY